MYEKLTSCMVDDHYELIDNNQLIRMNHMSHIILLLINISNDKYPKGFHYYDTCTFFTLNIGMSIK